ACSASLSSLRSVDIGGKQALVLFGSERRAGIIPRQEGITPPPRVRNRAPRTRGEAAILTTLAILYSSHKLDKSSNLPIIWPWTLFVIRIRRAQVRLRQSWPVATNCVNRSAS